MDKLKAAVNGFGRIGRCFFRAAYEQETNFEISAINDLAHPSSLASLLKKDSVHGKFSETVKYIEGSKNIRGYLVVNEQEIPVYACRDMVDIGWKDIDVVVECTGVRNTKEQLAPYQDTPVILSSPGSNMDYTVVLGVNDAGLKTMLEKEGLKGKRISNASCTTNSVAPPVYVIDKLEDIELISGTLNTIHAYTGDQRLIDFPHKDPRRARAAPTNIIPTSTGAAKLVGELIPSLKDKFHGLATRVGVPDGSLSDITLQAAGEITAKQVNDALKDASENYLYGIMEYIEDDDFVSSDVIGNPVSAVIDSKLAAVVPSKLDDKALSTIRILSWYDNEWGYASRLVDLCKLIGNY